MSRETKSSAQNEPRGCIDADIRRLWTATSEQREPRGCIYADVRRVGTAMSERIEALGCICSDVLQGRRGPGGPVGLGGLSPGG